MNCRSLPEQQDIRRLPSTPLRFLVVWARFQWPGYSLVLILQTLQASLTILIPYATSLIIAAVTRTSLDKTGATSTLNLSVTMFLAVVFGEMLSARLAGACYVGLLPRQRHEIIRRLTHCLQLHPATHRENDSCGALGHRIQDTAIAVDQLSGILLFDFWPGSIALASAILLLALTSPPLAVMLLVWALLFTAGSACFALRSKSAAVAEAEARSRTSGFLIDALFNLETSRLFANLAGERRLLDQRLDEEMKVVRSTLRQHEAIRWFQLASSAALTAGTLLMALWLWQHGKIGIAEFTLVAGINLIIINDAHNLSQRFIDIFECYGTLSNGIDRLIKPAEPCDDTEHPPLVVTQGQITFEHIHFSYPTGRPVFRDLSLSLPAGKRIGVVGHSGAGKSTLFRLLLRLYEPQQGRILIDGQIVGEHQRSSLLAQISVIPQEPRLFNRSLLDNIRYGRQDASHEEVIEAASLAQCHDFITRLPEGYHTPAGENGARLSGGQQQRIAIARAILKKAPILIMDEATASLDPLTEKTLLGLLDTHLKDTTVLVITHNPKTMIQLDEILVFEQGEIKEQGTHAELLKADGTYAKMFA